MNPFAAGAESAPPPPVGYNIEIVEPEPESCRESVLSPEGHVKLRNYRLVGPGPGSLRAYTPSGDVHTTPVKGKVVPRYDDFDDASPPRRRILELVRPDDPGRDALEAIVRPAPRRPHVGHADLHRAEPHVDDEAWSFLQRTLLSPSPSCMSGASPEPPGRHSDDDEEEETPTLADELHAAEFGGGALLPPPRRPPREERSSRREALRELRARSSAERERLARMALAVEEDETVPAVAAAQCGLAAAARQLDLMLAESRDLHDELAEIHDDMQAETRRAAWCAAAARALLADVHLTLGEVALESETYDKAVLDMQHCLKIQKELYKNDDRRIAETHYQIGLANSLSSNFEEAITHFKNAANILETRIQTLENPGAADDAHVKKYSAADPGYSVAGEVKELRELLPEIHEKIQDMLDYKAETIKRVREQLCPSGGQGSSNGASREAAPAPKASDISHLIKRKRKPSEGDQDGSPAKNIKS